MVADVVASATGRRLLFLLLVVAGGARGLTVGGLGAAVLGQVQDGTSARSWTDASDEKRRPFKKRKQRPDRNESLTVMQAQIARLGVQRRRRLLRFRPIVLQPVDEKKERVL